FARGRAILRGPASPGRTRARAWMSRPRAQRHSCRAIGAKKAWDPGEARVAPPVFGWRRQWMSPSVLALRRGGERQSQHEDGAARRVVGRRDAAAVALHDAAHDGEAEPRPGAVGLGREEGDEDLSAVL